MGAARGAGAPAAARGRRHWGLLFGLLLWMGACSCPGPRPGPGTPSPERAAPAPTVPTVIAVPAVPAPEFPARRVAERPDPPPPPPYHPYLDDTEREGSVSLGTVTEGRLLRGARLPAPADHLAVLPRQRARYLRHGTDELVAALTRAARRVARQYPGAVLFLGNAAAPEGGDIPWSVSHNSGRDVDLSFYVLDAAGRPAVPPDLLLFDAGGWAFDATTAWRIDFERTWALVAALLTDPAARVQFVFVYRPLARRLLEEGKRQGASAELLERASKVLIQPGRSPHNDHLHLRVHCSDQDLGLGCREMGPWRPGEPGPGVQRARRVAVLSRALRGGEPARRHRAAHLLGLLGDRRALPALVGLLRDADPALRARAFASLALLGSGLGAARWARAVEREADPAALRAGLAALTASPGPAAWESLERLCADPRSLPSEGLWDPALGYPAAAPARACAPPGPGTPVAALAAQGLMDSERAESVAALAPLLAAPDPVVAAAAHASLLRIANRDLGSDPAAWTAWRRSLGASSWEDWQRSGFGAAGFPLGPQPSLADAPALLAAVAAEPHLSYNARRALQRLLGGGHPQHLSWSAADAATFWRLRYEARVRR